MTSLIDNALHLSGYHVLGAKQEELSTWRYWKAPQAVNPDAQKIYAGIKSRDCSILQFQLVAPHAQARDVL